MSEPNPPTPHPDRRYPAPSSQAGGLQETTIGAFEAKNTLSSLLQRTARGESFVITNHGHPVARLTPVQTAPAVDRKAVIDWILNRPNQIPLNAGDGGLAALRAWGRR